MATVRRGLCTPTTIAQRRSQKDRTRTINSDAIDCDRKFQAELRAKWRNELEADQATALVRYRHKCQFFDFLCSGSGDELVPGAERFTNLVGDLDAKSLEFEICHAPPDPPSSPHELNSRQVLEIKQVLKLFVQSSRGAGRRIPLVSASLPSEFSRRKAIAEESMQWNDRVYRATFCRFVLDTKLVACGPGLGNGRLPFHSVVRFFDIAAIRDNCETKVRDMSSHTLVPGMRSLSIDQCVDLIAMLLGLATERDLVDAFEEGLAHAKNVMSALSTEAQQRASQARLPGHSQAEDAAVQKRKEFSVAHGLPPQSFPGTLRDWARGIQSWVDDIDDQSLLDCSDQQFMLDCFLRDTLVEPGVLHVCLKFQNIFKVLYMAYKDEDRTKFDRLGCPSTVPHMTYAAFFRFCVDFRVFPTLSSFNEVRSTYRSAECVDVLGEPSQVRLVWPEPSRYPKGWQDSSRLTTLLATQGGDRLRERRHSTGTLSPAAITFSAARHQSRRGSSVQVGGIVPGSLKAAFGTPPGSKEALLPTLLGHISMNKRSHDQGQWESLASAEGEEENPTGRKMVRMNSRGNTMSQAPASPCDASRPHVPKPRVKVSADWTWVRKPFESMSQVERNTYSLLVALNDCVQDSFLHIRGLVKACGLGDEKGCLKLESVPKVFDLLHVEHGFTQDQLHAVARLVDPGADFYDPSVGAGLDAADLEKAVDCVREDFLKRKLILPDMAKSSRRKNLGEEARRLSSDAKDAMAAAVQAQAEDASESSNDARREHSEARSSSPQDVSPPEPRTAFGFAAFVETLLLLGVAHMYREGVAVKASAPGGIKAMWFMSFLCYQFCRLLESPKNTGQATSEKVAPKKSVTPLSRTSSSLSPAWPDNTNASSSRHSSKAESSSAQNFFSASLKHNGAPEMPPSGARYVSCLERLLRDHADLFECVLSHVVHPAPKEPPDSLTSNGEAEACGHCRRMYSTAGSSRAGSLFCHKCSGVDDQPLTQSILFPLLDRRVLKRLLKTPPASDLSDHNCRTNFDSSSSSSLSSTPPILSARSVGKEPKFVDIDALRHLSACMPQQNSLALPLPGHPFLPTSGTQLPQNFLPREEQPPSRRP